MALRLDPKHFNSLINRGVAWEKMNKCDNALQDFTKAAEHSDNEQNRAYARFNRGCCHAMLKNWEAASKDFSKALLVDPANTHFRYNHAFALRQLGRFDVAMQDYQLTRALQNDDFRTYFEGTSAKLRGTLGYKKNLAEEALKHVSPGPMNPLAMKNLQLAAQDPEEEELATDPVKVAQRREAQNEEMRYILDKKPARRTGDDLKMLKEILDERKVWKGLEVSATTLMEMLRTMRHGREDPRSYLYHQTQMNEKLYVILRGGVTLQMSPPNPSLADQKLTQDLIFGNLELENMSPPEAGETALVDNESEFLIVSAREVKESRFNAI